MRVNCENKPYLFQKFAQHLNKLHATSMVEITFPKEFATNFHSSSKINKNAILEYTGPNMVFNGFGQSAPSNVATGGITLNYASTSDVYAGITGSTGYFQSALIYAVIANTSLVSSPYQYTLVLNDQTSLTSSYNYYYDLQHGPVSATGFSITGISNSTASVSGISLINGSTTVSTSLTGVQNIGKYYCNNSNSN